MRTVHTLELVSSCQMPPQARATGQRYLPAIITLGVLVALMAVAISRHESGQTIVRLQSNLQSTRQQYQQVAGEKEQLLESLAQSRQAIEQLIAESERSQKIQATLHLALLATSRLASDFAVSSTTHTDSIIRQINFENASQDQKRIDLYQLRDEEVQKLRTEVESLLEATTAIRMQPVADQLDRHSTLIRNTWTTSPLATTVSTMADVHRRSETRRLETAQIDAAEAAFRLQTATVLSATATMLSLSSPESPPGITNDLVDSFSGVTGQSVDAKILSLQLRQNLPDDVWTEETLADYLRDAEDILTLDDLHPATSQSNPDPAFLFPVLEAALRFLDREDSSIVRYQVERFLKESMRMLTRANRMDSVLAILRQIACTMNHQAEGSLQRRELAELTLRALEDLHTVILEQHIEVPDIELAEVLMEISEAADKQSEVTGNLIEKFVRQLNNTVSDRGANRQKMLCHQFTRLLTDPRFSKPCDQLWKSSSLTSLYLTLAVLNSEPADQTRHMQAALDSLEQADNLLRSDEAAGEDREWHKRTLVELRTAVARQLHKTGNRTESLRQFSLALKTLCNEAAYDADGSVSSVYLRESARMQIVSVVLELVPETSDPSELRLLVEQVSEARQLRENDDASEFSRNWEDWRLCRSLIAVGSHEKAMALFQEIAPQQLLAAAAGENASRHPLELISETSSLIDTAGSLVAVHGNRESLTSLITAWASAYHSLCIKPEISLADVRDLERPEYVADSVTTLVQQLNRHGQPKLAEQVAEDTIRWWNTANLHPCCCSQLCLELARSATLQGDSQRCDVWTREYLSHPRTYHNYAKAEPSQQVSDYLVRMREQGYSWMEIVGCHDSLWWDQWQHVSKCLVERQQWREFESLMEALAAGLTADENLQIYAVHILVDVSETLLARSSDPEMKTHDRALQYFDQSFRMCIARGLIPNFPADLSSVWLKDRDGCLLMEKHLRACLQQGLAGTYDEASMFLGIVLLRLGEREEGQELLTAGLSRHLCLSLTHAQSPNSGIAHNGLINANADSLSQLVVPAMLELVRHLKESGQQESMIRWGTIAEHTLKVHFRVQCAEFPWHIHKGPSECRELIALQHLYELLNRENPQGSVHEFWLETKEANEALSEILSNAMSFESTSLEIREAILNYPDISESQREHLLSIYPRALWDWIKNHPDAQGLSHEDLAVNLEETSQFQSAELAIVKDSLQHEFTGSLASEKFNGTMSPFEISSLRSLQLVYGGYLRGSAIRSFDGGSERELFADVFGSVSSYFSVGESKKLLAVCRDALREIGPDGRTSLWFRFPCIPKQVAVSTDGQKIAWCEEDSRGKTVVKIGGPGQGLVTSVGEGHDPMWSADGQRLYFLKAGPRGMVACVFQNEQRTEIRHLNVPDSLDCHAVLSHDGQMLLYVQESEKISTIESLNLQTGEVSTVLLTPHRIAQLSFSPNGQWLAYMRTDSFARFGAICLLDLQTQKRTVVAIDTGLAQMAWIQR